MIFYPIWNHLSMNNIAAGQLSLKQNETVWYADYKKYNSYKEMVADKS